MKDHIYTREWFLSHLALRDEYHAVADVLLDIFFDDGRWKTAVDIGCGVGLIVERLLMAGVYAHGLDGSRAAIEAAPPAIRDALSLVDLTRPYMPGGGIGWDLVICTEVAEHIEAQHADRLVEHVAGRCTTRGRVFFTAATRGQGGVDHVNEQPNQYWIEKFAQHGRTLDAMRTPYVRGELAAKCPNMPWFGRNAMVFR